MKRILYAVLLAAVGLLAGIPAAAQHFTCAQYETDAKRWLDIEQLFRRKGWTQWALAVKDAFPLNNDRSIQYKYVLTSDAPCSQKRLTELVQKWITLEHPNMSPLPSGETVNLKVQTIWDNVAHSNGLLSATYVTAKSETFVEFKEDRLRVTITVSRYVMGAASPFQTNSGTALVGDCYPFDLNGKWKNVLAMAYVNSNQKALEQVEGLLSYLNRHVAAPAKNDKEW